MPFRFSALLLSVAALMTLSACDDPTDKNRTALVGHWELTKALRNQRETGLLADIFFDFDPDGKMLTNLPVAPEPLPVAYEVMGEELVQKLPQPITYHIQSLNDSVLVLSLEMRSIPFELQLRKTESPAPSTEEAPAAAERDTLGGQ
jgi:hypothetical protein